MRVGGEVIIYSAFLFFRGYLFVVSPRPPFLRLRHGPDGFAIGGLIGESKEILVTSGAGGALLADL